MRQRRLLIGCAALIVILCGRAVLTAHSASKDPPVRFVFAGHIRGPRNFTVNSLLPYFVEDISHVNKDFVVMGGDIICGYTTAYDEAGLDREWGLVDTYLDEIDVPVYRVPGNHDWHSVITKEVFNRRYGPEYYSFTVRDVLFIGLNSTKLCPDGSLDWGNIWLSNSPLPNVPQIPKGAQWDFLTGQLKDAAEDSRVRHIVIFMNGCLWKDPRTGREWWERVHPMLVRSGKVDMVLSGEAGDDKSDVSLAEDGILYLRNGWGITDNKDFSLRGAYLQVVFEEGTDRPKVFTRFINFTPEYFQALAGSMPEDTRRHLEEKVRRSRGGGQSSLNRARMIIRDWMNEHIRIYDRVNNIKAVIVLTLAGMALAGLVCGAFRRGRKR
ncbi:MAG: metallophosphoesterase [Candidatus Omnitrophica bacterium]|nr:metallophosphoesterase [Candidatus Omnitrophota bacterium]